MGEDQPAERSKIELGENSILNRWDHGVYSGMGIAYNLGRHRLFVETNYYIGLRDAERFNASQNRHVNLNFGYMIGL